MKGQTMAAGVLGAILALGYAQAYAQRQLAEQIAHNADGVEEVRNELVVANL